MALPGTPPPSPSDHSNVAKQLVFEHAPSSPYWKEMGLYLTPLKMVASLDPPAFDLHQILSHCGMEITPDEVNDMGKAMASMQRGTIRWMAPGNAPCLVLKAFPRSSEIAETLNK